MTTSSATPVFDRTPSTPRRDRSPRVAWWALLPLLASLASCARFAEYQRADFARNDGCARSCEARLHRQALAISDGKGACTCYAPMDRWEQTPRVTMARFVDVAEAASPSTAVATADRR